MTEKIIHIQDINPTEFFGVNNFKFEILRKTFPKLKIMARGTQLKLQGAPEEIKNAETRINNVLSYLHKFGNISETYFEQVLSPESEEVFNEEDANDIIVFGPKGVVIRAKTANQKKLLKASEDNDIIFAIGPAGSGKTYTAVALAVKALKNKIVKKIILTRPAVEAGESLGFLPGDLKDKIDPYLRPLYDALDDMIPHDKLEYYMSNRIIEIAPLAYMRGRTLDHSFIILDEAQNTTDLQLKMFLTRIGPSAKAIITGDMTQIDLPKNQKSGLAKASNILRDIKGIAHIYLDEEDVVRHKLVKSIIKAYDKAQKEQDAHSQEQKHRKINEY